jgi:integrase
MARKIDKLTARKAATLTREGWHSDGKGLYLRVTKTSRSWVMVSFIKGRRRELGLGSAETVTLASARQSADKIRQQVSQGLDPLIEKRSAQASELTFGQFAADTLPQILSGLKNEKSQGQWRKTFARSHGYTAAIYDRPLSSIRVADALAVLSPLWVRVPEIGRRTRARCERIMSAAIARELHAGPNPFLTKTLKAELPKQPSGKNFAALPYRELPQFMAALREMHSTSARALEFLILTATRSQETRLATWSEFNFAERLWVIPPDRMKMGREHVIPLCDRAVEILEARRPLGGEFVFVGRENGRPLTDMGLLMCAKGIRSGISVHGFRSVFSDYFGEESDFPSETVEHALAHGSKSSVRSAYRRLTSIEKRRELMAAWCRYCAG